jgi:hypothetical protein
MSKASDLARLLNADGEIQAADIDDGAVTAAKLASTLDLSGKTVTLPSGTVAGKTLRNVHASYLQSAISASVNHSGHNSGYDVLSLTFTPPTSANIVIVDFSIPVTKSHNRTGFDPILYVNSSETSGIDGSGHFGCWYEWHRMEIVTNGYVPLRGHKIFNYNSSSSCTITIKVRVYDENTGSTITFADGSPNRASLFVQVYA